MKVKDVLCKNLFMLFLVEAKKQKLDLKTRFKLYTVTKLIIYFGSKKSNRFKSVQQKQLTLIKYG